MGCSSGKEFPTTQSILVLGASVNIGKYTVLQLKQHGVNVTAGVRDPSSKDAKELISSGVKVIKADMGEDINTLSGKLQGFDSVFLNTPNDLNRVKITVNAAKAAKQAGVSYVLLVTIPVLDEKLIFGKQFKELETEIKKVGITYGLLSLPMFTENILGQAESIAKAGQFYGPISGDYQYTTVAIQDAGRAAAQILVQNSSFKNQTIHITSDKQSGHELAKDFSTALGKKVTYINVGYEGLRKSLLDGGFPQWRVDGILELNKLIENSHQGMTQPTSSFKDITGQQPTSNLQWIKKHAQIFGGQSNDNNKIIVLGASGNIGFSTVKALVDKKANVTAGARDPTKSNLKDLQNTTAKIVKADMGQNQSDLAQILKDYNTVFIVTPKDINRSQLTVNAIRAAKQAKVGYLLVVTIPESRNQSILFGRQLTIIEDELKASGLNYGLIKLPMFMENNLGSIPTISGQNTVYGPIDGSAKYTSISVEDAGIAAAEILANPTNYLNRTILITGDLQSNDELAKSYSKALNREIKYVNATREGYKQAISPFMEEWQVNGILELNDLIQKGNTELAKFSDEFQQITGRKPQTNEAWMKKHAHLFTQKS